MATSKPTKKSAPRKSTGKAFSDEERDAMRERAREAKAGGKGDEESAVLEKIAGMQAADRALGERIHAIVKASAPSLGLRRS